MLRWCKSIVADLKTVNFPHSVLHYFSGVSRGTHIWQTCIRELFQDWTACDICTYQLLACYMLHLQHVLSCDRDVYGVFKEFRWILIAECSKVIYTAFLHIYIFCNFTFHSYAFINSKHVNYHPATLNPYSPSQIYSKFRSNQFNISKP